MSESKSKSHDGVWHKSHHDSLMRTISNLGSKDHSEYLKIKEISHGLLEKYTRGIELTEEQRKFIDCCLGDWWIDDNGTISSDGTLNIIPYNWSYGLYYDDDDYDESSSRSNKEFMNILNTFRFGNIHSLYISEDIKKFGDWTPKSVDYLRVSNNKLKSLIGGPEHVTKSYDFSRNSVSSLKGSPKSAVIDFDCSKNKLKTLKGMPPEVTHLDCSDNLLTSLEGFTKVTKSLNCKNNKLVSLKGISCDLSVRNMQFKGNPVSERTLKAVYNLMKKCNGDYEVALSKIWGRIPQNEQILMYKDNPNLTEKEVKAYSALHKYSEIENMI
jgi:Leucine-rich repeat (LRR) protein